MIHLKLNVNCITVLTLKVIYSYRENYYKNQVCHVLNRGATGSEFGRVPDPGTRPLLPDQILVIAGSGYLTCDM